MANILTINLKAEADSAAVLDAFAQELASQLGINLPCEASRVEARLNDKISQQGKERGHWWEEMSAWLEGVALLSPTLLQMSLSVRDLDPIGEWTDEALLHFPSIVLHGEIIDTTNFVRYDLITITNDDGSRELSLCEGVEMDMEFDCEQTSSGEPPSAAQPVLTQPSQASSPIDEDLPF